MVINFKNPILYGPRSLTVVRHGQSIGNVREPNEQLKIMRKKIPNYAFPLTDFGSEQIHETAEFVLEEKLIHEDTRLYTSQFLRAQETFKIIGGYQPNDLDVVVDPRLNEWWHGVFNSLSEDDRNTYYPVERPIANKEGFYQYRPPQGESARDVDMNILNFLQYTNNQDVFATGHGGVFRFMRRILLNEQPSFDAKSTHPNNGEVWQFLRKGNKYTFASLFTPKQP